MSDDLKQGYKIVSEYNDKLYSASLAFYCYQDDPDKHIASSSCFIEYPKHQIVRPPITNGPLFVFRTVPQCFEFIEENINSKYPLPYKFQSIRIYSCEYKEATPGEKPRASFPFSFGEIRHSSIPSNEILASELKLKQLLYYFTTLTLNPCMTFIMKDPSYKYKH